jgi:hypothetical protein
MLKENRETELINELIFLKEVKDRMWRYHPSNPNMVDVENEMESLQFEITKCELKLENIAPRKV